MSEVEIPRKCYCSCHTSGAIHCFPCCYSCWVCGEDRILDMNEHLENCKESKDLEEKGYGG